VLIFGDPTNDKAGDPFILKILVRFRYITSMSRPSKVKEGHPTDSPTMSVDGKDSEAMQEVLEDECTGVWLSTPGCRVATSEVLGENANPIGKTGG
jgi:hypothetical protein